MRRWKILLAMLRRSLRWSRKLRQEAFFLPLINPDEFFSLLRSGRKQDLETLARKLSEHPQASRMPSSVRPQHNARAMKRGTGQNKQS
jgi:hypothetical protein